jgi:hypothetical protein
MLTHDSEAFVEQIAIPIADKRATRRRQRISKAQVEVLQDALELRMVEQVLAGLERDLAAGKPVPGKRRRLPGRASRRLDPSAVRSHLNELYARLAAKKERAHELERQAQAHEGTLPMARHYRLHSTTTHATYSMEQYQQLEVEQRDTPVRIADVDGLTWWWFSDRFWWDDEALRASEVAEVVRERDRETMRKSDSSRRSLAVAAGELPAPQAGPDIEIPDVVRRAVRRRDQARCVECGSTQELDYYLVVPMSKGGSVSTPNVELRCSSCS